jgi:DNA mismatch repair protein MutS2
MPFRCDEATRARLEWPRLASALAALAATARGKEACLGELFCETRAAARERLAETDEARALLDAGEPMPLGGVRDLRAAIERASKGVLLQPAELAAVMDTLRASSNLRRFLASRAPRAPRLSELAGTLPSLHPLAHLLAEKMTPEGELRDDATPELRRLTQQTRDLEAQIEARMAACLRDPGLRALLQDFYTTEREGRPVLPVRADARQRVRGLVHDVSSSGTTVFVEPEAVVELGNRLRMARSERAREVERCLRELSDAVCAELPALEASGRTLEALDLAHARGRLSARLSATRPDTDDDAPLALLALRHPLLLIETALTQEQVIANDVVLDAGVRGLVISGPNAGGKTVAAKAVGLAALMVRAGLHAPCAEGSHLPLFDAVHADIGDEQDLRSGLSTFSARMANLARILREADPHTLVIVDEVGEGTEPGEGAALAQAVLEALVGRGAFAIATTHFNRLKELAGADPRFANASAEFDRDTLLPTYRVRLGVPGSSGASWVAERMGVEPRVVERARSLLDGEDRRLEALTRELSELRQELEADRRAARELRDASESARAAYEAKLSALRGAREQALASMRQELEHAYRSARAEIARVVRELQQGTASAPGPAANLARDELREIESRVEQVEHAESLAIPESAAPPLDWSRIEPGARVLLEGLRGEAILLRAPDRRGRIEVRASGARMSVDAARVERVLEAAAPARPEPLPARGIDVQREPEEASASCDLRGLRVDEALDRADAHLHQFLGRGRPIVRFVHGHGTGALRSAIRAWLKTIPEVESIEAEAENAGGNGVTIARLRY